MGDPCPYNQQQQTKRDAGKLLGEPSLIRVLRSESILSLRYENCLLPDNARSQNQLTSVPQND